MRLGAADAARGSTRVRPHRITPGRCSLAALTIGLVLATRSASADWRSAPRGEGPDSAPIQKIDGVPYLAVNDLARLLDATKFWRPDLRRLMLRTGTHTLTFVVDGPFAVVDERTLWLGAPVVSMGGEVQVPAALVDSLAPDSTLPRLQRDARGTHVFVLPASGYVGTPVVTVVSGATHIAFPATRPDEAVVVTRARRGFRVRFGGLFTGVLPDSLPHAGLVREIHPIASAGGSAFEMRIDPGAGSFTLVSDGRAKVTLTLSKAADAGEAFAPEDPPGPRALHVIVLDPGHGGADAGVTVSQAREKDLTLALALKLRDALTHELPGVKVVLTRDDDEDLPVEQRAERTNHARADLVLSLHFDGFADSRFRGASAWWPPATFSEPRPAKRLPGPIPPRSPVTLLPWRDVAARHGVQSRELAEAVLSALELSGEGPTRLHERMPLEMQGVNAPGILLECATLTAPADLDRVTQDAGLSALADAIAQGVAAYQRNE
jgi:N-acetylmuramoyl-L-alanine amidase